MFYSLLLYCFTFFGERGKVSIGLSFLAGVPKKVISLNFNMYVHTYDIFFCALGVVIVFSYFGLDVFLAS